MTTYECPLCKIRMDTDYNYELKYLWCDDCREKVRSYWKPDDFFGEK